MPNPPDLVALVSDQRHPTPTRLWTYLDPGNLREELRHGVFKVSDGRQQFNRVAYENERLRFDPFCMVAGDHQARRVVEFFRNTRTQSFVHEWDQPGPQVLLINNRRTLHARDAVDPASPTRCLQRVAFTVGDSM